MILTREEALKRIDAYADTHELAFQLQELADVHCKDATGASIANTLREARLNLLGLYEAARSLAYHQPETQEDTDRLKNIVTAPLSSLGLSQRTLHNLTIAGIADVAHLLKLSRTELLKIPQIGNMAILEMREALINAGLLPRP